MELFFCFPSFVYFFSFIFIIFVFSGFFFVFPSLLKLPVFCSSFASAWSPLFFIWFFLYVFFFLSLFSCFLSFFSSFFSHKKNAGRCLPPNCLLLLPTSTHPLSLFNRPPSLPKYQKKKRHRHFGCFLFFSYIRCFSFRPSFVLLPYISLSFLSFFLTCAYLFFPFFFFSIHFDHHCSYLIYTIIFFFFFSYTKNKEEKKETPKLDDQLTCNMERENDKKKRWRVVYTCLYLLNCLLINLLRLPLGSPQHPCWFFFCLLDTMIDDYY